MINESKYNLIFLFAGSNCSGKTSYMKFLEGKPFEDSREIKIGIDMSKFRAQSHNMNIDVKIFRSPDSPKECFSGKILRLCYLPIGVLLFYDPEYDWSFKNAQSWYENTKIVCPRKTVFYLVKSKSDISNQNVPDEEAIEYARLNGMRFYSMSVKDNIGTAEPFQDLLDDITSKLMNGDIIVSEMPTTQEILTTQNTTNNKCLLI